MGKQAKLMTIRIPAELKEMMETIDVNWSEEIRNYIEARVKMMRFAKNLEEIEKRAKHRKVSSDSAKIIREWRDER